MVEVNIVSPEVQPLLLMFAQSHVFVFFHLVLELVMCQHHSLYKKNKVLKSCEKKNNFF